MRFAVEYERIASIKELLAAGADVNATDYDGCNCVMIAALWGVKDCLKELLAAGADVNAVGRDGLSYLMRAIYHHGSSTCMQILLDVGADANAVGRMVKMLCSWLPKKGRLRLWSC